MCDRSRLCEEAGRCLVVILFRYFSDWLKGKTRRVVSLIWNGETEFFLCVEEETEKRSCTLRDKGGPGSLALGANSLTLSDLDRRRRSSGNASTCANIEASERRESWGEKRKYDSWTREFDEERERDAAYSI